MLTKTLFLVCLTIALADHRLKIVKPDDLARQFPNGHVTLHASSIGYIPTHSTITGVVSIGNPYDGCSELTGRIKPSDQTDSIFFKEFVLLDSSNCANSNKATNVYEMGGFAAIIVRDQNTQIEKHGTKVHIPVLEISPQNATVIKNYQDANPSAYIVGNIEFSKIKKSNKTEVDVWMSSTDITAYNFINNFSSFYLSQQDKILFRPKYFLSQKNTHDISQKTTQYVGCLSSGHYCAPEIEYQTRLEGKQVVEQDLRQLIMYKNFPQHFFDYTQQWVIQCLSNMKIFVSHGEVLKCSEKCMYKSGLNPSEIQRLYRESFMDKTPELSQNELLLEQKQNQAASMINEHPLILIDGKPPKAPKQSVDSLSDSVKYQVCQKQMPNYSQTCQQLSQHFQPFTDSISFIVLLTITLLIVFMGLSLLIYKCVMRRRMKNEIKNEVNRTLEQYYHYTKVYKQQNQEREMEEMKRQLCEPSL